MALRTDSPKSHAGYQSCHANIEEAETGPKKPHVVLHAVPPPMPDTRIENPPLDYQPDQSVTRESLARKTPPSPEVTATRGSILYTTWSGGQVKKSVKRDLQLIFMELDRRWTRSNDRRCQLYQHFLFPFSSYIFFFRCSCFSCLGVFFLSLLMILSSERGEEDVVYAADHL